MKRFSGVENIYITFIQQGFQKINTCRLGILYRGFFMSLQYFSCLFKAQNYDLFTIFC